MFQTNKEIIETVLTFEEYCNLHLIVIYTCNLERISIYIYGILKHESENFND